MNPLVPDKFRSKGIHGDAESWRPSEWKRTFWDLVSDVQPGEDADGDGSNEKSWEIIEWAAAKEVAMRALALEQRTTDPTEADLEAAETRQQTHWDEFYKCNKEKFFKDRMYLAREFPFLDPAKKDSPFEWKTCMEIGCGVGNTIVPLFRAFPDRRFVASDFAPSAVDLLKANPGFRPEQCVAYVCDIAKESAVRPGVAAGSMDIVIMIFVLSAIGPEKMRDVLVRAKEMLREGGLLLFRDYGLYDMTQVRFISKKGRKLADNYYARADGTRTYFFSEEHMAELATNAGFEIVLNKYDTRELRNRKRQISMYRVFVQGAYRKPSTTGPLPPLPASAFGGPSPIPPPPPAAPAAAVTPSAQEEKMTTIAEQEKGKVRKELPSDKEEPR